MGRQQYGGGESWPNAQRVYAAAQVRRCVLADETPGDRVLFAPPRLKERAY